MLRRLVVTAALALVPFAGAAAAVPAVAQADDFCTVDPAVTITTPQGNVVTVYLNVGAHGLVHLPALQAVQESAVTVEAAHRNSTEVRLDVFVPADSTGRFNYVASVSSKADGAGTIYVSKQAKAGSIRELEFTLNVA